MSHEPLWHNRNFRLVFGASALSHLGTGVYGVAFPWFATLLTRNPLLIGLVAMAPQLPWLFFALPAGVWTDRLDHRRTIVTANLLSVFGFCAATFVLVFATSPWLAGLTLFAEAFTGMLWNVVTVSYRQRHIPAALLGRVNAVYRFLGWGPRPFGSLLGGALVAMGASLGPFALHLPFLAATLGGVLMLIYCARHLPLQ